MLGRLVVDAIARRGRTVAFVDLADHVMPLYHGDEEEAHGPPPAARALAGLLRPASGLLLASPEYNGAMTPMLKNTIDWVTRVDRTVFPGTFAGLMSATPGPGGGRRGLDLVRRWLVNLRLVVADLDLSVPNHGEALIVDATTGTATASAPVASAIEAFVDAYLEGLDGHLALPSR